MPKRTSRSSMKPKNIYTAHAGDETDYGFIEMPPGIHGGVARVTKCYFGEYKKGVNQGETFFMAIATGIEPATAPNGAPARGANINLMEPMCETTASTSGKVTSEEEHVANVMNEMRKLGVDTSEVTCFEDLESLAQAIQDAAPYVRFSTSQGEPTKKYPDPRIWHNWNGLAEGYEQKETEDVEEEVGELPEHGEAAPEDEVPFDSNDINSLAEAADNGDEAAQEKLMELTESAGLDGDVVADTENWGEVADMLAEVANEDEKDEEPTKGDVYGYKPPRARKAVEVSVTAVFKAKKTCNIKNVEDNKTYKGVSWDKLLTE